MEIVKPHRTVSREVTAADLERVRKDASEMSKLLSNPKGIGIYPKGGFALAHCQVESKDPLRFFVSREGIVYVNPEIIRHTQHATPREEGCLTYSFPGCIPILVPRWHKIVVRYQVLSSYGFSQFAEEDMKGLQAQIFQHELDHFNGVYIYERAEVEAPKTN